MKAFRQMRPLLLAEPLILFETPVSRQAQVDFAASASRGASTLLRFFRMAHGPGHARRTLSTHRPLEPNGSKVVHHALGDILTSGKDLLIYDEEIPREGLGVERRRQLARW